MSVDRTQVRNYQSTPASLLLHADAGRARKHLAGVSVFVVQRQNSWRRFAVRRNLSRFCSQVSSLCRTSLWNNSFTLAAAQYGHNQSCHQPAVQTQAEELYSYENHGESIQGPQCSMHNSILYSKTLCHLSQPAQNESGENVLQI